MGGLPPVKVGAHGDAVGRDESVLVNVANDPRVLCPDFLLDAPGPVDLHALAARVPACRHTEPVERCPVRPRAGLDRVTHPVPPPRPPCPAALARARVVGPPWAC